MSRVERDADFVGAPEKATTVSVPVAADKVLTDAETRRLEVGIPWVTERSQMCRIQAIMEAAGA
jgi:hypothetical protein